MASEEGEIRSSTSSRTGSRASNRAAEIAVVVGMVVVIVYGAVACIGQASENDQTGASVAVGESLS